MPEQDKRCAALVTAAPEPLVGTCCRICGNDNNNRMHSAKEMFFGMRDKFDYLECARCGTLQIVKVPELGPYYPPDYYSFEIVDNRADRGVFRRVGKLIRRHAADYWVRGGDQSDTLRDRINRRLMGKLTRIIVGYPDYLRGKSPSLNLTRKSAILDVGSGAGTTLEVLREFGFTDLVGIDPFLKEDIRRNGIHLLKRSINEIDGRYDLILANHSIEHDADPRAMLKRIYRLLGHQRYAIVRMPVLAHAWRRYGVNWVQLDAPRHLSLFSHETFLSVVTEAGFRVPQVSYDSTAFQFWGSEQYLRNIPLLDETSYFVNPERSLFTPEEITDFAREAVELNTHADGDQATFYLFKS